MDIEIAFEDPWLLIVNKPSGLPTQGTLDPQRKNLYSLLQETKRWPYLGMHHRLDTPTSGLVLFTKDRSINKDVSEFFKEHKIKKNYFCLVKGAPTQDEFEIKNYLKTIKKGTGKAKMRSVNSGGDFAHTLFQVIEKFKDATLLKASPQTGRMHQIRVHLSENKLPILGDSLYFRADRHFPRLLLHAAELHFTHPKTHQLLNITAPLPLDFKRIVEKLDTGLSNVE